MNPPRTHDLRPFVHGHTFGDAAAPQRERALWWVTVVTLAAMVMELVVGYWSGSLALVADGWHMGTHALALGGAALAALLARRAHANARFAFGGWKIEVLAAYSSGLLLLAVSLWVAIDAVAVLLSPRPIAYQQAIVVAVIGLAVNAACAWLLQRGAHGHAGHAHAHGHHHHGHRHAHDAHGHDAHGHDAHGHDHVHGTAAPRPAHDHNYRAATLHVLADALTSVLAIVALAAGWMWGWRWLDPVVALAGGALIAHWAIGVLRDSARSLVDASSDTRLRDNVRRAIETDGDARVADLHVWQIGPQAWSAVVSVVADQPLASTVYRERLHVMTELQHVTIEVHQCPGCGATSPA
ncbi:MAG TPA: CDF family Co(II)/Ni(II) efflux transporter DmeF [Burkholderiaceae bacterium]|nr:CDF family Co(II)/Ni(II) efflux transporter DmeF [Burkholderiaceae bacterium]